MSELADGPWPTSEQFDQAATLGTEYALQEFAAGSAKAQDSPLSGEWADGMTSHKVARNVGFVVHDVEAIDSLADAWETAYFDQWGVNYQKMAG